jgi:hypothetical protein
VKPYYASMIAVQPCGDPASSVSARFCSAPRPPFRGSHRHCTPVRLSRGGCSCQCSRAAAPMILQRVHTMRGPNVGTGTSSDHRSALKIARWWHAQQHTSSDRTPLARMLPRVIGSIGSALHPLES